MNNYKKITYIRVYNPYKNVIIEYRTDDNSGLDDYILSEIEHKIIKNGLILQKLRGVL